MQQTLTNTSQTETAIATPGSVAYMLSFFPLPSETFIVEEILSLYKKNIRPHIIYQNEGNLSKVHPSAQALIDRTALMHFEKASRMKALGSLLRIFIHSPLRTLRNLTQARAHPQRWRYRNVLPTAEWCLQNGIEFLHVHFADENLINASIISAWTGIPYGITTHGYDIRSDPIGKSMASELFHKAAVVVTISEHNRQFMVKKYGLPESRIHIVHSGVNLDRFAFSERQPPSDGQPFRLLSIGRLVPEKAYDVLLEAMHLLKMQNVPFQLEIIGDGPLQEELKQLAEKFDILDNIVFHGVQIEAFVKERHTAVDLFVLSSRNEGLPVVCIEALALGTPVVATRISGIPELIEDGVSGWLVPAENPELLAEAIRTAYADPAWRRRIAIEGRRVVENAFERNTCTTQLVQLWRGAIKGSSD